MNNSNEVGYNGNPLLKKANTPIPWSQEQIDEYIKCKEDPIYFAEKYVKVVNVDEGFITIKLYDYQKTIIEKFKNNRKIAIVQSRQSGKTTTAACIILHYILFNNHKLVGILANKADAAKEVLKRVKDGYEALPDWLQQGIEKWNEGSIELENKTKVIAAATSSSAIRGKSVNLLYIDETAFVPNWPEFSASVLPTISSGKTTKLMYSSTPKGLNHFHKIIKEAKENKNGFAWVEVPWQDVPGRDEEWRKGTLEELGGDLDMFAQEYSCSFIGSSGTLLNGATLKSLSSDQPIHSQDGLTQYIAPKENHSYSIVCDVSQGKGLDYSAFQVIDVTEMPYQQVCVYRNNEISPYDYAGMIHMTSKAYNNAMILVEVNDVGGQVSETLHMEYGSENMIFTESAGPAGKKISSGFGRNVDKGIRTSSKVKSVGCSMLKLLMEQQQLVIRDSHTIEELSRFSKKGNSYEAESGYHDDMVMPLVLFAWMSDQTYFKDMTNINTLHKLRDRTDEDLEQSLTGFGFINTGLEDDVESVIDLTKEFRPEFINF